MNLAGLTRHDAGAHQPDRIRSGPRLLAGVRSPDKLFEEFM